MTGRLFPSWLGAVCLLLAVQVACAATRIPQQALRARPNTCNVTQPQELYTLNPAYLTWTDPLAHAPQYNVQLSNGVWSGDWPDAISFNGTRASRLSNSGGTAVLDASSKTGSYVIEFDADNMQPQEGVFLTGRVRIESTDFQSTPADDYTPFMQGGLATQILQHGCTVQGEPSFPQLQSRLSSWGHCNVYLNDELFYENLWLHTMLSNPFRDPDSLAIYADSTHTTAYSPHRCWEGDMDPTVVDVNDMTLTVIAARWCWDPNAQVHPQTDVNFVIGFHVQEQDYSAAAGKDTIAQE